MNSKAQQVYYPNMASNIQWVASSYPLHTGPFTYKYFDSSFVMMTPHHQGNYYYIPNGQFTSPYIQTVPLNVQQFQYNQARTDYGSVYTTGQYQPYGASAMMHPVQYYPAPLIQWQAPPTSSRKIIIRDPNQGGRDITEKIMSGINPKNTPTQDHVSHPVASIPSMEGVDATSATFPSSPSSSGGSEDVPVTKEEKKEEEEDLSVAPSESALLRSFSDSTAGNNEVGCEADGKPSGPVEVQESRNNEKEERIKKILDLTVERAMSEPNSSVTYADMCHQMQELRVPTLKKLLLSRCQEELKKEKKNDWALAKMKKALESATEEKVQQDLKKSLEEEMTRALHCSLLNMEFVAELFKRQMLPKLFINSWIEQKLVVNPSDENLECLCRLLSIAGKDLQGEENASGLDRYISMIKKIIQQKKSSPRICCMLQDLVDLKLNNWESKNKNRGIKNSNQVNKEEKKEQQRNLKEKSPVQQWVPSRTCHQSSINQSGALNRNQLDAPKTSPCQYRGKGGRSNSAKEDRAPYFRKGAGTDGSRDPKDKTSVLNRESRHIIERRVPNQMKSR